MSNKDKGHLSDELRAAIAAEARQIVRDEANRFADQLAARYYAQRPRPIQLEKCGDCAWWILDGRGGVYFTEGMGWHCSGLCHHDPDTVERRPEARACCHWAPVESDRG